jgi:ectoine hydroxylase-related dioxygenase (phytanoyl-CoA dioxygenase family)
MTDTIRSDGLDLHPWNEGFTWEGSTPPFRRLTTGQVAQFDREGFVVVPDVFGADEVAGIVAELDGFEADVETFLAEQDDQRFAIAEAGAITFSTHLVTRSARLRAFAAHPFFVDVCADLVGPDVNLYWDQAVYKKPDKPRRFPWHQDNGYAYVEPQQYLTCWVALTDATADNGCPQVARGLHRAGTLAHTYVEPLGWECLDQPEDVALAEVRAGGVVVFSSLTPHLTGPNLTDHVRKAYILQYAPVGAAVLKGDPARPPTTRATADDPGRQFPVLRDCVPVDPPPLTRPPAGPRPEVGA